MQHIPRQRCSRSPGTALGIAGPFFRTSLRAQPALPGHALGRLLAGDRAWGNAVPARRRTGPCRVYPAAAPLRNEPGAAAPGPGREERCSSHAGGTNGASCSQPDSDLLPQHSTDASITEVPLASNPSAPT